MSKSKKGNCFIIEIGLDGIVLPRYDGTYPYLMSLVKVDDFETNAHPVAAWFTDLNKDDRFVFRVFNYQVTDEVGLEEINVKGLFALFLDPMNPRGAASCTDEDMICTGKDYYPDSRPSTPSCVRPGATGWRFLKKKGKERHFKFTEGLKKARMQVNVAATFPSTNDSKELRWYTHDPEIFVGESGRPPTDGEG
jgi:hypothetical protein